MLLQVAPTVPAKELLTPTGSCWDLALEIFNTELTRDPKKIISTRGGVSGYQGPVCPLSDLHDVAREYANGPAAGRSASFKHKMQKLIATLSEYCIVIDVMVNHSPEVTALVWGGIRMCIMTAARQAETSAYIADTVVFIIDQIGRSEQYYQLHPGSPRVCNAVSRLYAQVINFTVRAARFKKRRGICYVPWALFASPLAEKRLQSIVIKIKELSETLREEAEIAFQENQREQALKQEARQEVLLEVIRQNKRNYQMLEWFKPAMSLTTLTMDWEDGTCEWVFQHEAYKTWAEGGYSRPLWMHGMPGCGKSVIAGYLSKEADTAFIFSHTYALSGSQGLKPNTSLAASILCQILKAETSTTTTRPSSRLEGIRTLLNRYPSCASCPFEVMWSYLEEALASLTCDFTLILDALDECRDTDQVQKLLSHLNTLAKRLQHGRIILISRYRNDYEALLPSCIQLPVDQSAVSLDILHFVRSEIDRAPALKPLQNEILARVEQDSIGMFLWAKLMMDWLKTAATTNTQRERLRHFPVGLEAVYDQFLAEGGDRLEEHDLHLRAEIFSLLVAAERLLCPAEISLALALKSTCPPNSGDELIDPKGTILRLCSPMVTIDANDGLVRLIHHSLRDFLVLATAKDTPKKSLRISAQGAHQHMAGVCLNMLCQPRFTSLALIENLVRRNVLPEDALSQGGEIPDVPSLYEYASFNWHTHVALSPADEDLAGHVGRFLTGIEFIAWAEAVSYLRPGHDLGPVLSARAALLGWHATQHDHLKARIGIEVFFKASYQSVIDSMEPGNIMPLLLSHRLGTYFNLAVEEHEKRFEIVKAVMEGSESHLGPTHAFTLKSRAEYGSETLIRERFEEAEAILWNVYSAHPAASQSESKYIALSIYANALYHQLKLDESIVHQRRASEGLLLALGPVDKKYLKSQLFLAQALEAQGQLDDALAIYDKIWQVWVPMYSRDEGLAMFAQIGMATVYQKRGDLNKAMDHGTEVLQNRRRVFGDSSPMTADTALILAILSLERGEYGHARGHLSLVPPRSESAGSVGTANNVDDRRIWLHRQYLAASLEASLDHQTGRTDKAVADLQRLILDAEVDGLLGSRALLQARLMLSDILEAQGQPKTEILGCFSGLVEVTNDADVFVSADHGLELTRKAARLLLRNDRKAAEVLLGSYHLRWKGGRDYWMPIGGPFPGL
ncbi:hypothetical protein QBC34DRAFT_472554 [Podospora aff. communis PSN243]|uniref:NACHT domain-containing protein n=1 Tax=Podospora aff. communis PSN243 TaxID=3040156 RepID=A0AAV9GD69_9PEZI|nr:hypothetical protein QBC34DRAFT_472554 [Podospora aff. communis PSN243]